MKRCRRCQMPVADPVKTQSMHSECWAAHMREYREANREQERNRERVRARLNRAMERAEIEIGDSE